MALKLITAPAEYPVTLEMAKEHLRVIDDDDEALIEMLLGAATRNAERFLGRALIDQTWELVLDGFPTEFDEIKIPLPPLIEVVSVAYDDEDGNEQTLSASVYTVDNASEPGWITSESWPSTFDGINAVRIRFRAGYIDTTISPEAQNVPFDIRAAVLLSLGSLYEHRETVVIGQTATALPWGAEQLLRMHRIDLSMA